MYRLLEIGEVIENGDEYYGLEDKWLGFPPSCVGMKTVPHDAPIRRLVKPAVTPAASSVPDPGVSVGDRVKVLSGPWAGCAGVVVYVQVEATMSGFALLTAREDSKPAVLLDNVFVGGNRLMVAVAGNEVEPLPAVVPEVLYRDLSHGEIIRIEDEYLFCGGWLAGSTEPRHVGRKLEKWHVRLRRPVRLQSPGWRYLDAGETVQSGDETFCENVGFWPLSIVNGSQVNNERMFRRKLPANQGG